MRSVWRSCGAGLAAALAAGAVLWAAQERYGNALTMAVAAAVDSPWEWGKAVFFALLCGAPVVWRLGGGSRSGLCAMALAGATITVAATACGLAPPLGALAGAGGAMALYGGALHRIPERAWWGGVALCAVAAYILLTLLHPAGGLFAPAGDVSAVSPIPF